ncbi:MAG: hypothetical protein RL701_4756 [Pseudomonadota bacterium]|jgi:phosphatidylglycerophosphate synthase
MMRPEYRASDLFTLPSLLSLSRVLLAAWFPFAVQHRWLALGIVALAGVSDYLDGVIARRRHQESAMGAALDPTTDKIFAASVIISMLLARKLSIASALLLSTREVLELPLLTWLLFCVPRQRFLGAPRLKSNWLGKLTTGFQFCALTAAQFNNNTLMAWATGTAVIGALAAWTYWMSYRLALRGTPASTPNGSSHSVKS